MEHIEKVFAIMNEEFGIKLNIFESLYSVDLDKSILKAKQIV